MKYKPSEKILDRYADVLVNFALNRCKGIKKGDVVLLNVPEIAKPLLASLRRAVLKSGGHPITNFIPDDMAKEFYELASEEQIKFFPDKQQKGLIEQIDHSITIIADTNKHELEGIKPEKIMKRNEFWKKSKEWRDEKENAGKFTWTLALFGTEAMAKEANMSLVEYWKQIIRACYLDEKYPIKKWKETAAEIERVRKKLDSLKIEKLHVKSDNIDLVVGLGKNRKWLGGRGANIPSFEVFISPDFRKTEGKIFFNQPLYRYGNLVRDITIEFRKGKVVRVTAKKNEEVLKEMVKVPGADMIGEFSLTDSRLSRINKFMGETLFDENMGGKYGNMHLALGASYKDSYPGDLKKITKEQWMKMGYNDSSVHTDMISTENKIVKAYLSDGTQKIIYKDGKFVI